MNLQPFVYILTNHKNGTLYVGMTTQLIQRVEQHQAKAIGSFTEKYDLNRLVWYEIHPSIESAAMREKALKRWRRVWKIRLIEKCNPLWKDLSREL